MKAKIFLLVLFCLFSFSLTCKAGEYHINYLFYDYNKMNSSCVVNYPVELSFVIGADEKLSVNELRIIPDQKSKKIEKLREISMKYRNFIKQVLEKAKEKRKMEGTEKKEKKSPEVERVVVYFKFDSAEITEDQKKLLKDRVNLFIKKTGKEKIRASIYGYADCTGEESYNKKLSLKRAKSAAEVLKEMGIVPEKVEGRGETGESENPCLNRKAEIFLKAGE